MTSYVTEAEFEAMLDRRVHARIASDPAYKNAEDSAQQAEREHVIEEEENAALQRDLLYRGIRVSGWNADHCRSI